MRNKFLFITLMVMLVWVVTSTGIGALPRHSQPVMAKEAEGPATEPERGVCVRAGMTRSNFSIIDIPASARELLIMVKASPEFHELKVNMVSEDPNGIWEGEGLTFFVFDLWPDDRLPDASIVLYPYAIFAASEEQGIVTVIVATPDLRTMHVELENLKNPELSQTVALSEGVTKKLREAEEKVKQQKANGVKPFGGAQPLGPCQWYCMQWVYHPGYLDSTCAFVCGAACSYLPPVPRAACYAACYVACWVPGWYECVNWQWFCGLP